MPESPTERALSSFRRTFRSALASFEPGPRVREEGRVVAVGDGVAAIRGLPNVAAEEVVRLGPTSRGLVLGLEREAIHAVVLDDLASVRRGARVRGTGQVLALPVGPELEGRVIDPLGRPLDGRPLEVRGRSMPLEGPAPGVHERGLVHQPLLTGVLVIDAMLPVGRGQRELICGDEGTGKSSLAFDALVRQATTDVVGIYVAIGRRRSETWRAAEALRQAGGRWIVVAAPEDSSPGLRYLAPYAGCAVGEAIMGRGEHALVVYDDLTSHAVAWRELALLMRRPPGREAFPGDVFYLHSRLLERATQLSTERGGGSLTALPVARLESGRLSAYLPTNLISITDGQIVLDRTLFAAGQRPAVDVGLSVSRIGGKAQPQALRALAGRLRLAYARFVELEVFSRVGARLEEGVERTLALGRRQRMLLRQPRLRPLGIFGSVVRLVWANTPELLLAAPVDAVTEAAERLEAEAARLAPQLAARLEHDPRLSADDADRLAQVLAACLERVGLPSAEREAS
ncbi:MAG: F0F1 ATP synthase subunit alpha [Sandaracinaceae bacterium]